MFHYPDDYTRIKEEIIYLEDDDEDLPSKNTILVEPKHIGLCIATSFLSLLASHPLPKWGWIWLMPQGVFWVDIPQDRYIAIHHRDIISFEC